ncbi:hypothetical protein DITRI_Ditri18aG0056000 [Diplodiscus trichospermus]
MSSIGARCAEVYHMRERQKEKMKRMEEARVSRGESSGIEKRKAATFLGGSKVHPGNFTSSANSAGNESQGLSNTA